MNLSSPLTAACCLLLTTACTKSLPDVPDNPIPNRIPYTYFDAFLVQPSDGTFDIWESSTDASQGGKRIAIIGGTFYDRSFNTFPGGPVTIAGIAMHDTAVGTPARYEYGNVDFEPTTMYGTTVNFDLNPNPDGATTGGYATTNLYVPKLICLNAPGLHDTISANHTSRQPTIIAWNADLQDTANIFLLFQYDPTDPLNSDLVASHPSEVDHLKLLQDVGSYTFQPADAAGFPANSWISVQMTRHNYAKIKSTDGTRTYLIYASTKVINTFFYQP